MWTSHAGVPRIAALVLVGALSGVLSGLGLGCATTVDAAFDPGEDFSRLRVWKWEPADAPRVDAPGRSESTLDATLRRLIHDGLATRGYAYGRESPDFLVRYRLSLEPRTEIVLAPHAPHLLSSLSYSPSFWVWGNDREVRRYDDLRLSIDVSAASGRPVWRGALHKRLKHSRRLRLDAAVTTLLARLPRAAPRPPAGHGAPDRLARRESRS